ncbi:MAG: hypothetical protein ACI9KE_002235 [Polyangiales bacterium]|jgi:hypothetical protein
MPDSTTDLVPFHMAKEDLLHLSTSSFVEFCMTPGRRWDERAREPLASMAASSSTTWCGFAARRPEYARSAADAPNPVGLGKSECPESKCGHQDRADDGASEARSSARSGQSRQTDGAGEG